MNLTEKVKELNLPFGKYAVFGSGPLSVHGIRETRDIDIITTPEIYHQLKTQPGWEEKSWPSGGKFLSKDEFEVTTDWKYKDYDPNILKIISEADIISGIPFIRLEEVIAWKKAYGREKDLEDIKLIENYLINQ